jgi:hypothetical protein
MVRWCVETAFLLAPVSVKMVKGLTNLMIELSHALSESAQRWAGCAWAGLLSVSSNAPSHHRTIVPFMFFIVKENYRPARGLVNFQLDTRSPFQATHHRTIVPFMFFIVKENYRPVRGLVS